MFKSKISNANALFGHLFFIVLFVFAAVFYRERMLFSDPSFFSFNVIWKESFDIALGRWGTAFSQILPILAVKLDLPLKLVLQSYSINFVLLFFLLFLGLNSYLKSKNFLLPFAVSLVLTFRLTFYYPTAELYFGSFLSLLLIPILWKRNSEAKAINWLSYLLVLALAITQSYFHQLTLFPLLFILGLSIRGKKDFINKLGLFALIGLWYILRVKVFSASSYESDKLLSGEEALNALFNLNHTSSFYHFRDLIFPWMKWFLALAIISSGIFIKQKRYFKAAASFFGPLVYWVVVIIVLYKGESRIMLDNYYSMGGFFLCMPFAFMDFKKFRFQALRLGLAIFLCGISFYGIYRSHYEIAKRHIQTQNVLDYMAMNNISRGIIANSALDYRIYFQDWALPFESIYQNHLNGASVTRSFFASGDIERDYNYTLEDPNVFLGPGFAPTWFKNDKMLHSNYFHMENKPYTVMNSSQDLIMDADSMWASLSKNIKQEIIPTNCRKQKLLRYGVFNFRAKHLGAYKIPSLPGTTNSWRWAYYFINANGERLEDIQYADILLDLPANNSFQQALVINPKLLKEQDVHAIRVDLFSEKYGFLDLNMDFNLIQ